MDASPLGLYYRYASLWRNAKVALQSEQSIKFEFAMRKWSDNDVIAVALYGHSPSQAIYSHM